MSSDIRNSDQEMFKILYEYALAHDLEIEENELIKSIIYYIEDYEALIDYLLGKNVMTQEELNENLKNVVKWCMQEEQKYFWKPEQIQIMKILLLMPSITIIWK